MRKRAIWLAAATAAALVSSPAAATQWGSYHWATDGNGLTLNIERQITTNWVTYFDGSVSDWNASDKLSLTGATSNLGVDPKKCNPIASKALVCNATYGFRGWLGVAQIWASGDHITQATTKLNDSYFNTSTYDDPDWRTLVACQEIGHDFGLDHQDETFDNVNKGTCMDYTNAPAGGIVNGFDYGPSNLHPNGGYPTADYDTLDAMYAHNDFGSGGGGGGGSCNPHKPGCTGAQTDAFTFREVGKSPSTNAAPASSTSWGVATGYDRAGRPNTFLLDLGNGKAKLTHVFWAKGFHPTASDFHD
jgi:hypothetical protein